MGGGGNYRGSASMLVVQDHAEQAAMDRQPVVVIDKAQLLELSQTMVPGTKSSKSCGLLTALMFNLCNAFRTDEGQALTEKGIRRFWRQQADDLRTVVVFAGPYFAICDIEEFTTLLGKPPQYYFRAEPARTKATYGMTRWAMGWLL